jgi:hypothetical protein
MSEITIKIPKESIIFKHDTIDMHLPWEESANTYRCCYSGFNLKMSLITSTTTDSNYERREVILLSIEIVDIGYTLEDHFDLEKHGYNVEMINNFVRSLERTVITIIDDIYRIVYNTSKKALEK